MKALTWLSRNVVVIGVVGGTGIAILGAAFAAYHLTARFAGNAAAFGVAATVAGAATARAALAWSRLAVVEGATK
jgi:hypothetical protein